jgi:hypothetical protein
MAFIEGSEKPNEVLVISAHYDHVGVKMEISITALMMAQEQLHY